MARRGSDDGRLQSELERLYALPPPAFTAARNELAVRLRQQGRRGEAATVKALPRPTPSSWAVSRLLRLEPARFKALLAAGRQARQAQHQVLGGRSASAASSAGPAARLREALQSARSLVEELRRRGLELLAATGRPASAANAEQLSADLQALAFTAGAESAIERGWLDGDLDAPGFEVLAGLQAAAGPSAPRTRPGAPSATPTQSRKAPVREPPGRQETARRGSGSAATGERRRADQEEERQRRQDKLLRQDRERREREQARLQQARERQQARLADAEAEVRRAADESARLEAAAAAADAAATDAKRQAAEAQREAVRASRASEQARSQLERARELLKAVRAPAAPGIKA
jgi:DNA repair exonuclease SbcCD ATPase subunit